MSVRKAVSEEVSGPVDSGNGKKLYTIGTTKFEVDCKYDVMKAVGFGAYGVVCSACDTETGQKVAIKKIPHLFEDLVDGKRILREIKLLGFLRHPNLLSILDMFRPRDPDHFDEVYFVTEFLDTDLSQIIRSKQRLTEDHVRFFTYQALRALLYIHSANVLHRDIKPGNLLVNADCDLKVCDFGLARGLSNANMTDYVVTRWYRPPELLLLCERYDGAVDMWSLGCITVELVTRRTLFPGKDYINQVNLITDVLGVPDDEDLFPVKSLDAVNYVKSMPKKKRITSFAEVCSGASPALIDFVSKLLVINPAKRLTAAQALRHPFFEGLSDPSDEPVAPATFKWELDDTEITEAQLRTGIWEEILRYRP